MAINFPFSPKIDQVYTQGNLSWQWNGIEWVDYISVIDNLNISNALSIGGKITGYNNIKIANGQILIGNSLSGSFESATLTGGSGIDIANDSGTITITANVAAISGATSVVNASGINGSINSGVLTLSVSAGAFANSVVNASGLTGYITDGGVLTLGASAGAFANTVSNGGGITGYITGGGALTLGSNATSSNVSNAIVSRDTAGSFNANVVTASRVNVTSTTGTSGVTSGALVVAGGVGIAGGVWLGTPNGDEGGQLNLALAAANTTLNGSVVIDVYQNKLRIFEAGGTTRGVFIDLTATGASATTNLLSGSGSGVTSVSNGGGITGTISGSTLTLGSNGSSANGASTIVTRDAAGNFAANVITANNGFLDGTLRALTQVVNGGSVTGTIVGNTLTLGGGSGGGATSVVNASGINGSISSSTLTLSVIPGAFANSVTNGGGITGYITGGGALTLGSNGSSANGASTIVTRGADGSFEGNVITAVYGNIWGNAGTGSASFSGGTTLARLSGNTSAYSEPRLEFGERALNATAAIASKNETNGGGSLYILTRNTSSSTSTLTTRIRVTNDGNLVVYGNILSNSANSVADIGNSTNYFGNVYGTAMLARYADLAESYSADQYYSPGTVVEFGGIKEITLASNETARVAGVISTKPAYLMNMEQQDDNMLAVALQGRVPCQVLGVVHKGDMMVSAGNGYAKACSTPAVGTIIGKALENHFNSSDGVIEVVVGIR